ncbi:4Fe-4S double cluster binding domain-containing protein [Candidatus Poribacteria bacterium]
MVNKDPLGDCLHEEALALGADYFGVADLSPAYELINELGGQMTAQFPLAISIGVRMPLDIVDQLSRHDDKAVALAYRSHGYDIINIRLNQITSRLSSELQRKGYRSFPIAAAQTVDSEKRYGLFSHKLAANLAGLGWVGKSCLLVTPEVGPRARWASILTDAPLTADQPMAVSCGECSECVQACPAQAFTGRNFRTDEPRELRFDVTKCYEYQRQDREGMDSILCGVCVYVCPHGKT